MTAGHFNISRALFDSDLKPTPRDPACKAYAWVWIIGLARWRKSGGLQRGEFHLSIRRLADEMCWPKSVAERFLSKLLDDGRLRVASGTPSGTPKGRHLSVVKYEEFQTAKNRAGRRARRERDNKKKKKGRSKTNGVAVAFKGEGGDAVLSERPVTKKTPAAKRPHTLKEQRAFLAAENRKAEAAK